jgi:glycosyltransferase involved in cell wall biosynthesis
VSLYETFGHPVLEAFATGTPLLTSSRGATAEVAGGAALLADPEDVDSIASGLREIVLDADLRARLVEAGRRRVREFTWQDCARQTVDVLASVAAPRR